MVRVTAHFTGRVQGVGFRYTTCNVARGHEVAGFVMNLPDGRVKCVVEGERPAVKRFLDEVERTMSHHVTAATRDESPATGEFDDFAVKH